MAKKPIALIIMDGYGINQNTEGNAIVAAKKPHLDKLLAEYPHSQLSASGLDAIFHSFVVLMFLPFAS